MDVESYYCNTRFPAQRRTRKTGSPPLVTVAFRILSFLIGADRERRRET